MRAAAWNTRRAGRWGLCLMLAAGVLGTAPASAHRRHHANHGTAHDGYAPVSEWILLDAETGQVLGEENADALTYPASLTKMMTLYLTFEALNQGRIRLDQRFPVSQHAAAQAPSKLGLTPGDSVTVHNLILAIVTKSANDAAVVLAEGLAGSEQNFARYMTWKARQLGMAHTWYDNASGLPDPQQRTTARDVARLALALYRDFPREYRYFDTQEFDFRGETVHGHNHLLEWYQGADGIKTGFINASGFNLAASAVRNGHRLIGVVMGGRTWRSRDQEMAALLDQGFAALARSPAPQPAPAAVVASAAPPAIVTSAAPPAVVTSAAPPAAARVRPIPAVAVATKPAKAVPAKSGPAQHPGFLGHVASNALHHLAPVTRAEAATLRHTAAADDDDWAIQLGAYRAEASAVQVARKAARYPVARGKKQQIAVLAHRHAARLYRARLLHFTEKGARAACSELHRHKITCAVVPAGVTVATR
jgi:D-alanyl-D-alanine carboxypeptidase